MDVNNGKQIAVTKEFPLNAVQWGFQLSRDKLRGSMPQKLERAQGMFYLTITRVYEPCCKDPAYENLIKLNINHLLFLHRLR